MKSAREIITYIESKLDETFLGHAVPRTRIVNELVGYVEKWQEETCENKRQKETIPLLKAIENLIPHIHEEKMEGETDFERAWLKLEKVVAEINAGKADDAEVEK